MSWIRIEMLKCLRPGLLVDSVRLLCEPVAIATKLGQNRVQGRSDLKARVKGNYVLVILGKIYAMSVRDFINRM